MPPLKTFADGSYLEYGRGRFDPWCVYLVTPDGARRAPRDAEYFSGLAALAARHGAKQVYRDFIAVYGRTDKEIRQTVLADITTLSCWYNRDSVEADRLFSILYFAMIAEERKENTHLGKRIKRLGVYQVLMEGKSAQEAAVFMKGMTWPEIDSLCKARGF